MAQPLEDPSPSPHYAPCAMVPPFPPPFGLAAALTSPRLPMPSPTPPPPPPPPPHLGACAPHPMLMLQWIRSLLVQACPSSCTSPNTAIPAPPPPPPPPVQPFCTASEAVQLAGLLSAAKPTALPQSSAPPPPLDPFLHEPLEWRQANQEESEQLRRFRQALCTGSLDPQTMKIYQNFRYSLKISNHGTARRKNTTRETTGLLKAWLNEHRKNPYPNKSEKIMLAVITKMSLTQVSTWFANARRRLKKENKATWSMTLDPHFPDVDEGFPGPVGGDFREGETYPATSPPPPSQIPSPLASHAEEVAACGKEMKKEAVTATKMKRSGKIWSVVEMTEGG